ncbi:MAG: TlpA family protein disulfide reductase [Thiohalorhabdus sp.]|uniref:TlpA family protein disulfide reductase n=1 Tax=Thiohalorhabdus sp. TaxID=3094134 RepID=UPI003980CBEA
MTGSNRIFRVATILVILGLSVGLAGLGAYAMSRDKVPDVVLEDLEGESFRLSDHRGKLILVNFWAPWCPPCRQEMPDLQAFHEAHEDTVVVGLAINYRSRENVEKMVDMMNITYPVAYASPQTAEKFGSFRGLPATYLVSPDGRVIGHHSGIMSREEMEAYRDRHLGGS